METQKAVVITDTDNAREYLVQWMREHFPSDQTFSDYIREELAGDFAWQLGKALSAMQSPDAAAVSRAVAALEPFAKLAHLFSPEKRRANVPTTGLIVSWPRLGLDGEMVENELTVEHLREADAAFRAAAGLPEVERARARLVAVEQARLALLDAQEAQVVAVEMPHWNGIHPDLEAQLRKLLGAVEQLVAFGPLILPPAPAFAGGWTSVASAMPNDRERVWASTGGNDTGNDCFFGRGFMAGRSGATAEDETRVWRYTFGGQPVPKPVTHWMELPQAGPGADGALSSIAAPAGPQA